MVWSEGNHLSGVVLRVGGKLNWIDQWKTDECKDLAVTIKF